MISPALPAGRAELPEGQADAGRGRGVRRRFGLLAGLAARTRRHDVPQRRGGARPARPAVFRAAAGISRRGLARLLRSTSTRCTSRYRPSPSSCGRCAPGLWLRARQPKVIAITAARPSEGKTTTAIALARSAAINGEHVVVVDCDIRYPALAHLFGAGDKLGLVDCLLGHATLEEIVRTDELTGAAYIPAGSAEANAAGLFTSAEMTAVLEQPQGGIRPRAARRAPGSCRSLMRGCWPGLRMPPCFACDGAVLRTLSCRTRSTCWPKRARRSRAWRSRAWTPSSTCARASPTSEVYHPRYGGYFRE